MKQNGSDISPRSMKKAKLLTTSQEKTADSESSYNAQKCGMDANQGWGVQVLKFSVPGLKQAQQLGQAILPFFPCFQIPCGSFSRKEERTVPKCAMICNKQCS